MRTLFDGGVYHRPVRRSRWRFFLAIIVITLAVSAAAITVIWQYKRQSPEYTLAMIANAANSQDDATLERLIDFQAVASDFVPQITDQAIELYGRGADSKMLLQAQLLAKSILPLLSEKVRPVLKERITEEARPLAGVPTPVLVFAAERYLEIETTDRNAAVRLPSDRGGRIILERRGNEWIVTGYQNPVLAREIARLLGDEVIRIADIGSTADSKDPMIKSAIDRLLPLFRE
ncbi:MAG: hypothetical protein C4325_11300 [Blastocatellia bacterium]